MEPVRRWALLWQPLQSATRFSGDVISEQASRANVMDLEIVWASAALAPPSVSLQDLSTEFAVGIGIQPEPRSLRSYRVHDAFRTSSMNSAFSG